MPSNYFDAFGIVSAAAATLAVTPDAHAGQRIILDRAAGVTATLPAATGSGVRYEFIVATTVTSNGYIVRVANAADTMVGTAITLQDAGDTMVGFEGAGTSDTITLNGTTTGGIAGARIVVDDVKANLWAVSVVSAATGTEATPFSATVS